MDDVFERSAPERRLERSFVGEIDLVEGEARAARVVQPGETILLQADLVVVIEVVDTDHLVATREQAFGQCRADEPGGPGYENAHGRNPAGVMVPPRGGSAMP